MIELDEEQQRTLRKERAGGGSKNTDSRTVRQPREQAREKERKSRRRGTEKRPTKAIHKTRITQTGTRLCRARFTVVRDPWISSVVLAGGIRSEFHNQTYLLRVPICT
jgi:hypothetical protein